jgi:predicted TPR repeat methyltransferase
MTERFNETAHQWDSSERRVHLADAIYKKIAEVIPLKSDMELLDLGAGTGLLTFKILPYVKSITAVDISSGMLEQLMKKVTQETAVITLLTDLCKAPLDREFDGVISSMTLHHIKELQTLFKNLYLNLKEGGFLALADLEHEDGSFHSDHKEGNEGVHHFGFKEDDLRYIMEFVGFKKITFHHTHVIKRDHRNFPIFLVTAIKE